MVVVVAILGGAAAFVALRDSGSGACSDRADMQVFDGDDVDGMIAEGAVERWCLDVRADDTPLRVRVYGGNLDTTLALLDDTDAEVVFNDDTHGLDPEVFATLDAGEYTLEVAAWSATASGFYSMAVALGDDALDADLFSDGSATTTVPTGPTTTMQRPTTTLPTPTTTPPTAAVGCDGVPELGIGEDAVGFVPEEGVDRWCLQVEGGSQRVVVRVYGSIDTDDDGFAGIDPDFVDTTLRLVDAFGEELRFNDDTHGFDPEVSAELEPGTYFLEVESWSFSESGDYRIEIRSV
ncbi:MAG: hypothetical protein JJU45_05675 [Acidimicrobiia bacterium]|nr:hypothetical protein [Acidimicrobiia bacterium]